jgi:flagellar capping protein FliD
MAEILSTSYINSLISSYQSLETFKLITPLTAKKEKYGNLSNSYASLISNLEALKTVLQDFKKTGTDSIFSIKEAVSSNTKFLTASAGPSASSGSYDISLLLKQVTGAPGFLQAPLK